jgi:excisionase family DNA binding protein
MSSISRRDDVAKLVEAGLSYAEIGRRLGITRERVRQIAKPKPRPKKFEVTDVVLPTSAVARLLGVHVNTAIRWNNQGIIRAYRIGPRRDRRYRREDVLCVLDKLKVDKASRQS